MNELTFEDGSLTITYFLDSNVLCVEDERGKWSEDLAQKNFISSSLKDKKNVINVSLFEYSEFRIPVLSRGTGYNLLKFIHNAFRLAKTKNSTEVLL